MYQDQQDHSLALNWDQPTISPVYNVLDDSGLSRSSVDSTRAAQTGSTSTVGVVSDGDESAGTSPDMSAAADYRPDEPQLYETSDDYSKAITEESVRNELIMTDEQISATTPSEEGTEESSLEDTEEPSADEDTGVTEQSEDAMAE